MGANGGASDDHLPSAIGHRRSAIAHHFPHEPARWDHREAFLTGPLERVAGEVRGEAVAAQRVRRPRTRIVHGPLIHEPVREVGDLAVQFEPEALTEVVVDGRKGRGRHA